MALIYKYIYRPTPYIPYYAFSNTFILRGSRFCLKICKNAQILYFWDKAPSGSAPVYKYNLYVYVNIFSILLFLTIRKHVLNKNLQKCANFIDFWKNSPGSAPVLYS